MEPRNRFQGTNSASLCSLAGRYDNPIPTQFLAPIDCLKKSSSVEVTVNNKEENSYDFCLDFVQEFGLRVFYILENIIHKQSKSEGGAHCSWNISP